MKSLPDPSKLHLSIIPSRYPKTKVHTSLGDARKALAVGRSYWRDENNKYRTCYKSGKVYNIVDGEWNLLYDVKDRDETLPWQ